MEQTPEQIHAAALEWLRDGHCPEELKMANGALNKQDSELIGQHIESHHGGLWSVQTLNATVSVLSPKLHWRSKAEVSYDIAYAKLTPAQQDQFGSWWHRSAKKYVETENDFGFENAAKIIRWCLGKTFTADLFDRAVGNLFATEGLHPGPVRQQGERRGHADDGQGFMRKEEVNVSVAERARRDRERQEANQPKTEISPNDPNSAEWKRKADALTGATHSDTAVLARMAGTTHYETYQMRQRYLNQKQRANFNRTAI